MSESGSGTGVSEALDTESVCLTRKYDWISVFCVCWEFVTIDGDWHQWHTKAIIFRLYLSVLLFFFEQIIVREKLSGTFYKSAFFGLDWIGVSWSNLSDNSVICFNYFKMHFIIQQFVLIVIFTPSTNQSHHIWLGTHVNIEFQPPAAWELITCGYFKCTSMV